MLVNDAETKSKAHAMIEMTEMPFTLSVNGGWLPMDETAKDGKPVDLWHAEFGRFTDLWWDGGWSGGWSVPASGFTHYRREVGP